MKVKMFNHMETKHNNQTNSHTSQQANNSKMATKTNAKATKKMEKTAKNANQTPKKRKKTFECADCSLEFGKKRELQEHRRSKHPRLERANTCAVCKRTFESENRLRMHLQFHNKGGEYVCFYCNKQFNKAWKLKIHLINHSGKAPFLCQFCGEDFLYPGKFVQHLKHMHDIWYACKECGDVLTLDRRTCTGPAYAGGTYMDRTYDSRAPGGTNGDNTNAGSTYASSSYNGSTDNNQSSNGSTYSGSTNNSPTNRNQTDSRIYNHQTNNGNTNRHTNSPTYEPHRCKIYGCKDCVVFFATRSELVSHIENHKDIIHSNDNNDLVIFDLKPDQEKQDGTCNVRSNSNSNLSGTLMQDEKQVGTCNLGNNLKQKQAQVGRGPNLIREQTSDANLSSNLRQNEVENASLGSNLNQNKIFKASLSANSIQEQGRQVQRVQTRNLSSVSDLESDLVICDLKEEQLESPDLSPMEEDPLKIDEVNSCENSDKNFGGSFVGVDTNERPLVVCDGVPEGVGEDSSKPPTNSGASSSVGKCVDIRFVTFPDVMNSEKCSTQNQSSVDDIFQCKENGTNAYKHAGVRQEKVSHPQQTRTHTQAHSQPQQMQTDEHTHIIHLGQAKHTNAETISKTFQSVLNASVREREKNRERNRVRKRDSVTHRNRDRESVRERNGKRERESIRERNRESARERDRERASARERGGERESVRETDTELPIIIRFLKEGNLTNKQQTPKKTNNNGNKTRLQRVSNNNNNNIIGSVSFESWLESTQNFDQDYVFGFESNNSSDIESKILKNSSDFKSNCVNNLLDFESVCVNNSCDFLASSVSRNINGNVRNNVSNNVGSNVSNNSFTNKFFKQTNKNKIFSLKENAEMTFEDLCQF